MSGYQRGIRDARREFNAKLLRGDPISPQDVVDRYIIANKAKWEEMKEMSQRSNGRYDLRYLAKSYYECAGKNF